jgi:hypothetical protein
MALGGIIAESASYVAFPTVVLLMAVYMPASMGLQKTI